MTGVKTKRPVGLIFSQTSLYVVMYLKGGGTQNRHMTDPVHICFSPPLTPALWRAQPPPWLHSAPRKSTWETTRWRNLAKSKATTITTPTTAATIAGTERRGRGLWMPLWVGSPPVWLVSVQSNQHCLLFIINATQGRINQSDTKQDTPGIWTQRFCLVFNMSLDFRIVLLDWRSNQTLKTLHCSSAPSWALSFRGGQTE